MMSAERQTQTPATLPEVMAAIEGVEGWLSDDQAARLHAAAGRLPEKATIVEIGSFRGRSTTVLALGSGPGVAVFAVDPFAGGDRGPQEIREDAARGQADCDRFLGQIERAGVVSRVNLVRKRSDDPMAPAEVPEPVDLLYIDGAHRYMPARDDIAGWGERVSPGGTMLIHDSFSSVGVTLASIRLLFASSRWLYVGRSRSLAEYRLEELGPAARAKNFVRQAAQLPWFARNIALKVMITLGLRRLTVRLGHDGSWPY